MVNATIYLEAAGVAWIWLHQVLAAHGKTGDFYEGKRLATRYFFHHDLPKTTAQFDLSTAATEPRPIWTKTGSSVADARARRCIPAAVSRGYITVRMPHLQADSSPWRTHLNR